MRFFIVILTSLLLSGNVFAQDTPSLHTQLESQIKINRSGKGNSTFVLTVSKLQALKRTGTLKTIESMLGAWQSYATDNSLGYEWNDETRKHDIPLYQVRYQTIIKNKDFIIKATAKSKLDGRLKDFTVIIELSGLELAKFKKSLQDNGYLINENLTDIFRKQTWDKDGAPVFTIKKNANGTISIGVFG